jgi:L-cysteine:1D-myo-inositol 2-amino-2-deoxy-alpha-D-glucopyranoside ligase
MNSWASLDIPEIGSAYLFPPLSLFDTASASKKPLEVKNLYRLYVCGITPYDATHLGHAATYLAFDLAHRYLLATGAEVRFVQNITDIDDPLLERAARDGQDWRQLAQSQIDLFRGDMVNLHIIPPAHYIGVVEAMPLIIDAISLLERKGSTYAIENDLYFSTRSDAKFGSRSHLSEDEMATIFAQRGGDPLREALQ